MQGQRCKGGLGSESRLPCPWTPLPVKKSDCRRGVVPNYHFRVDPGHHRAAARRTERPARPAAVAQCPTLS
jgi:hypothetical protein